MIWEITFAACRCCPSGHCCVVPLGVRHLGLEKVLAESSELLRGLGGHPDAEADPVEEHQVCTMGKGAPGAQAGGTLVDEADPGLRKGGKGHGIQARWSMEGIQGWKEEGRSWRLDERSMVGSRAVRRRKGYGRIKRGSRSGQQVTEGSWRKERRRCWQLMLWDCR